MRRTKYAPFTRNITMQLASVGASITEKIHLLSSSPLLAAFELLTGGVVGPHTP